MSAAGAIWGVATACASGWLEACKCARPTASASDVAFDVDEARSASGDGALPYAWATATAATAKKKRERYDRHGAAAAAAAAATAATVIGGDGDYRAHTHDHERNGVDDAVMIANQLGGGSGGGGGGGGGDWSWFGCPSGVNFALSAVRKLLTRTNGGTRGLIESLIKYNLRVGRQVGGARARVLENDERRRRPVCRPSKKRSGRSVGENGGL